jgi:glucokinase
VSRPVLGIDVGGTKLLGCAVDAADPSDPLLERRIDTPADADALLEAIETMVRLLQGGLADAGRAEATGLGVGVPALVALDGVLCSATHLAGLADLPLRAVLRERLGLVVQVDNDANCAALAEARFGAAQGQREVLVVTLGTGIGAGIVTGGRLLRGAHGLAGEPGHMVVVPDGRACPCGRRGCWERYASGTGLGLSGRDAAREGRAPGLVTRAGGVEQVRGEHVVDAAIGGEAGALVVMEEFAGWVALGLANLTNILDPAVIVLGGGLVDAGDVLLAPVREAFDRLAVGTSARPLPTIEPARLGPLAGAVGAASIALPAEV